MKIENVLSIKRVLPTLLGAALLGGLSALPTLAQSNENADPDTNTIHAPASQDSQSAPESVKSYILDYPDFVVVFPIQYPTFSAVSDNNDVVLWPSQDNINNGTGYIYLLRGNTLYKENVNTLDVVSETTMPSVADNDIDSMPRRAHMHRRMRMHRNLDAEATMTDMGLLPPAVMTTNGDSLYLIRGNTLYKFDTSDLSLVDQTQLPSRTAGDTNNIDNSNIDSNNSSNDKATPDENPMPGQTEDQNKSNANDNVTPDNSATPNTDQNDNVTPNSATPDTNQNRSDIDRLDETHPDNLGPSQSTDDSSADNSTSDHNR